MVISGPITKDWVRALEKNLQGIFGRYSQTAAKQFNLQQNNYYNRLSFTVIIVIIIIII